MDAKYGERIMLKVISKATTKFTIEEAHEIGEQIGIEWKNSPFSEEEFRKGLEIEMEHGVHDPETDVIGTNRMACGKITWAHLKELDDYYTRLIKMEAEAET